MDTPTVGTETLTGGVAVPTVGEYHLTGRVAVPTVGDVSRPCPTVRDVGRLSLTVGCVRAPPILGGTSDGHRCPVGSFWLPRTRTHTCRIPVPRRRVRDSRKIPAGSINI